MMRTSSACVLGRSSFLIARDYTGHMSGIDERMEAVLERAGRFFMGKSPQHLAAAELAKRMSELGVDYAIVGALALGVHGHERYTSDVDVLITRAGLDSFKKA